jgi:hypothetical protein
MATRLLFDLGLNRSLVVSLSGVDNQVRRTVLWGCITIDRLVATDCGQYVTLTGSDRYWGLFLGRPTSIKLSDISVINQAQPMKDCTPLGADKKLETDIYEALIYLMSIAAKVTDAAHRQYRISDPTSYLFVAGIGQELRDWQDALPEILKWQPNNLGNAPASYFTLHQQYHTLFILIYRPFTYDEFHEGQNNLQERKYGVVLELTRETSFTHANHIARIFSAYCQIYDIKTMYVTGMQHAATAAIAIVEGMSGVTPEELPVTLLHLECLAEVLKMHALCYFPAKVMSGVLFGVIAAYRADQALKEDAHAKLRDANIYPWQHSAVEDTDPKRGDSMFEKTQRRDKGTFSDPSELSVSGDAVTEPAGFEQPALHEATNWAINLDDIYEFLAADILAEFGCDQNGFGNTFSLNFVPISED